MSAKTGVSTVLVPFGKTLRSNPCILITPVIVNSLGLVFFGINSVSSTAFELTVKNNQSATAEYRVHWLAVIP